MYKIITVDTKGVNNTYDNVYDMGLQDGRYLFIKQNINGQFTSKRIDVNQYQSIVIRK